MDQKTKKEKYASYYKTGKGNIITFINKLKTGNTAKLRELYEEICEEEGRFNQELIIKQRKLESSKKYGNETEEIEDTESDIAWIKSRLEFIEAKKDIVQKELEECEQER